MNPIGNANLIAVLLLTSACGRVNVEQLPIEEDTSKDAGSADRERRDPKDAGAESQDAQRPVDGSVHETDSEAPTAERPRVGAYYVTLEYDPDIRESCETVPEIEHEMWDFYQQTGGFRVVTPSVGFSIFEQENGSWKSNADYMSPLFFEGDGFSTRQLKMQPTNANCLAYYVTIDGVRL